MKIQEVFNQIVKVTIAVSLKKYGFKKKGNSFARTFPRYSWMINVQSSSWNTSDEVEFTIIINGLKKREVQEYYENPHNLAVFYHECGDKTDAKERLKSIFAECETIEEREETKDLAIRLGLEISYLKL